MRGYGLALEKSLRMEQRLLRDAGFHSGLAQSGSLAQMVNPLGGVLRGARLGLETSILGDYWRSRSLIEQFSSPTYLKALRTGFETSALASAMAADATWAAALHRETLLWGSEREWNSALGVLGRSWDRHLAAWARAVPEFELERVAEVTVRAWRDIVERAEQDRSAGIPDRLLATGRGALGILAAGSTLLDEEEDAENLDDEEVGLLSRDGISDSLRRELRNLHPHLPARLDAAWACVERREPASPSLAAHALMELIDWALRLAAPDEKSLAWHNAQRRSSKEVVDGRPTRTLRARYVLQDRREDQNAARLLLRGLGDVVDEVQKYKHSLDFDDTLAVARLIPSVEGILIYLFV